MNNLAFILSGFECKANHPITCLNPEEWFKPVDIMTERKNNPDAEYGWENVYLIRGEKTCWFRLDQVEIRKAQ